MENGFDILFLCWCCKKNVGKYIGILIWKPLFLHLNSTIKHQQQLLPIEGSNMRRHEHLVHATKM